MYHNYRYAITKAFIVAFLMTFFSLFDVPVFWPILLCYWIVLFALTMKRQIMHMIKYKYVPFNFGKQVTTPTLIIIKPQLPQRKLTCILLVFCINFFLEFNRNTAEGGHLQLAVHLFTEVEESSRLGFNIV